MQTTYLKRISGMREIASFKSPREIIQHNLNKSFHLKKLVTIVVVIYYITNRIWLLYPYFRLKAYNRNTLDDNMPQGR